MAKEKPQVKVAEPKKETLDEELSKLSPAERIKRLKQIEEEKKKEIEKIHSALEESIRQVKEEEMRREIEEQEFEKRRNITIITPEKETLESTVRKAPELTEEQKRMIQYGNPKELLEQHNPYLLANQLFYNRLGAIREQAKTGYISSENRAFLEEFSESLYEAKNQYIKSPEVREMLTRAEEALKQIEMYKSGQTDSQKRRLKTPTGY